MIGTCEALLQNHLTLLDSGGSIADLVEINSLGLSSQTHRIDVGVCLTAIDHFTQNITHLNTGACLYSVEIKSASPLVASTPTIDVVWQGCQPLAKMTLGPEKLNQLIYDLSQLMIFFGHDIACTVGIEFDVDLVPYIAPLRMVVHLLSCECDTGHKSKCL